MLDYCGKRGAICLYYSANVTYISCVCHMVCVRAYTLGFPQLVAAVVLLLLLLSLIVVVNSASFISVWLTVLCALLWTHRKMHAHSHCVFVSVSFFFYSVLSSSCSFRVLYNIIKLFWVLHDIFFSLLVSVRKPWMLDARECMLVHMRVSLSGFRAMR